MFYQKINYCDNRNAVTVPALSHRKLLSLPHLYNQNKSARFPLHNFKLFLFLCSFPSLHGSFFAHILFSNFVICISLCFFIRICTPTNTLLIKNAIHLHSPPPQIHCNPLRCAFPRPSPSATSLPPSLPRKRLHTLFFPRRLLIVLCLPLPRHRLRPRLAPLPPFRMHSLRKQTRKTSPTSQYFFNCHKSFMQIPCMFRSSLFSPNLRLVRRSQMPSRLHRDF